MLTAGKMGLSHEKKNAAPPLSTRRLRHWLCAVQTTGTDLSTGKNKHPCKIKITGPHTLLSLLHRKRKTHLVYTGRKACQTPNCATLFIAMLAYKLHHEQVDANSRIGSPTICCLPTLAYLVIPLLQTSTFCRRLPVMIIIESADRATVVLGPEADVPCTCADVLASTATGDCELGMTYLCNTLHVNSRSGIPSRNVWATCAAQIAAIFWNWRGKCCCCCGCRECCRSG